MYNVFVAEDEKWLLNKLKKQLAEFPERLSICGEADNGDEACSKLEHVQPDILITDIRMPGKDGLEVAKYALTRYPGISCIMISGYRDFEFAREALMIGTIDYLLKPVEVEQLHASLKKAMQHVQINRIQSRVLSVLTLEPAFQKMADGDAEERSSFVRELLETCPEFATNQSKIMLVLDDDLPREKLQKLLWSRSDSIVFHLNNGVFAILAIVQNNWKTVGYEALVRDFATWLQKEFQITFAIGASEIFQRCDELYTYFQQAFHHYAARFYEGDRWIGLLRQDVAAAGKHPCAEEPAAMLDVIVQAVESSNMEEIDNKLDRFFSCCTLEKLLFTEVHAIVARMIRHVLKRFDENQLQDMGLGSILPMAWVQKRRNVATLKADLKRLFEQVLLFQQQFGSSVHSLIGQVQYIVQNEYHRSELSITELADRLHFNQSYLSSLFKKKTGVFFYHYVTRLRMEKAMEMLKQKQLKTYEIAYSVGYTNEKSFSRAFKKMYNLSPQEYRKKIAVL